MDAFLQTICAQTIYVAPFTGNNSTTGKPTWGTPVAYAARVESKKQVIDVAPGTKVSSNIAVYTPAVVSEQDRVWLPGVNTTTGTPSKPVNVAIHVDEYGQHSHSVIYV